MIVLYAAGSYTMGRLIGISGIAGGDTAPGRMAFYLFIFPGVVLHESAHYLACLLTGTKVLRFAPFSPRRAVDGRVVLGFVRHERRAFPIGALVGLAPVLLNPLGVLLIATLLTPLSLTEVASPSLRTFEENILASGFLTGRPLIAAVWAYLSLCFALGSVPSREDLSSVPALLLIFGGGVFWLALCAQAPAASSRQRSVSFPP
ncbi:MAG: hypothetical protein M3317_14955 [Actinomycetota bacterium]|nr:hypothetical protein [Actinomycetota bacterium]